ncbi:unnamed protein product [Notodromas monacha]|uniref:BTB domain-containing protein n=1 Tax=Notodromas monacha TaxID=399045 RepID=A0A7R9BPB0_9CRUS|nr:unnamed protein product [Notodromas monacha]CAG0919200.1 unnamed protein product [Notodromas monacha]
MEKADDRAANRDATGSSPVRTVVVNPDPPSDAPKNQAHLPNNWQARMSTLKERMNYLFCSEVLCDVHFLVGKYFKQRIPAHKFVLSAGSAVFNAMFNGPFKENSDDDIELPDVEPAAFLGMLSFLYKDEVDISPDCVMTMLYTAKKYAIPALEKTCVDYLKTNLNPGNAFLLLTQARLFDEQQLAELCLDIIDKHTGDAMFAEDFVDTDVATLCVVLKRNTLRIVEAKLFQAVLLWSKAECERQKLQCTPENQRVVLDEVLPLIRFPLMTIEEFATGPAQSQVLSDREMVNLFLHFTVHPKPKTCYVDVPRSCMTGKELSVVRFGETESRWGYSGTSDKIRFVVDRRIFVFGFGLYGSINPTPQEYKVTISLMRSGCTKHLALVDTTFCSDGTADRFRVHFPEPVEVLPNVSYTAAALVTGPDTFYGTNGLSKVTVDCPLGGKITFHFAYAAGNNNGTSVDDGQLPEILFYVEDLPRNSFQLGLRYERDDTAEADFELVVARLQALITTIVNLNSFVKFIISYSPSLDHFEDSKLRFFAKFVTDVDYLNSEANSKATVKECITRGGAVCINPVMLIMDKRVKENTASKECGSGDQLRASAKRLRTNDETEEMTVMIHLMSDLSFLTYKDDVSTYWPNYYFTGYVVGLIANEVNCERLISRSQNNCNRENFHPALFHIYIGTLWIVQVLRVQEFMGTVHHASQNRLSPHLKDLEMMKIPGPLVDLFRGLSCGHADQAGSGLIGPRLAHGSIVADGVNDHPVDLLFNCIPPVAILRQNMRRMFEITKDRKDRQGRCANEISFTSVDVAQFAADKAYPSPFAHDSQTDWTAHGRLAPGLSFPLTFSSYSESYWRSYGVSRGYGWSMYSTEFPTYPRDEEGKKKQDWISYLGLDDLKWFNQVAVTVGWICDVFEGSCALKDIPVYGRAPGQAIVNLTTKYVNDHSLRDADGDSLEFSFKIWSPQDKMNHTTAELCGLSQWPRDADEARTHLRIQMRSSIINSVPTMLFHVFFGVHIETTSDKIISTEVNPVIGKRGTIQSMR